MQKNLKNVCAPFHCIDTNLRRHFSKYLLCFTEKNDIYMFCMTRVNR